MGKARRIQTSSDRLRKNQIEIKQLQGLIRNRNTPRPVASTAFAGVSAAGSEGGTGNFLALKGDTMIGPLALAPPVDFRIQMDADGVIDIGESSSNSQYSSNIQLDDIQPNTTTLDTIAGAAFDGQILIIRTFAPGSITIAQATFPNGGNIQTPDDTDVTVGNLQTIVLIFDASLVIFDNAPGGTWRLLNTFGTGGGGELTEPIILGLNTLIPQTLPTTTTIAWNTKNPHHIILDRAVEFDFVGLPPNGSYQGILVIIDIDAVGGFASPIWPASLVNPPIIPTTPLSRFQVLLNTIDNGTVVSHATSVGSSTGGEFFGPWTATHDAGTRSLVNLALSQYVDVGSIARGSISGDATNGLQLSTIPGGKFSILDVITPIATFDDTTGLTIEGTHIINMNKNIINTIGQTRFDRTVAFSPTVETGISFDNTLSALNYNIGLTSDVHTFRAAGELLASITRIGSNLGQIQASALIANNTLQASQILFLGSFTNSSPTNGDIWRDSTSGDFQFRQNGVTEGLGGGIPNSISEGDSSITVNDTGVGTIPVIVDGMAIATFDDTTGLTIEGTHVINMNKNIMNTIGSLQFDNTVTFTPLTVNTIGFDNATSAMKYNVALTTDIHSFQAAGELLASISRIGSNQGQLSIEAVVANILQANEQVFIADSSTDPTSNGEFRRNGNSVILQSPTTQFQRAATGTNSGQLALVKVDAAPSGGEAIYRINFKLFDDPTTITYAQIKGGIEDVTNAGTLELGVRADGVSNVNALFIEGSPGTTNRTFVSLNAESRIGSDLKFQAPTGSTDLKIFPALNQLGIVVQDNVSFTVGDDGTIAIPVTNLTSIVTVPLLDAAFGNHKGSIGIDLNVGDDGLWVRRNDTVGSGAEWARFDSVTKLVQP